MRKRNVLNSPRLRQVKKKKRKIFWLKVLFFALLAGCVLSGIILLARWQKLNIQSVQVIGADGADASALKGAVEKEISGDYLLFLPKANIFIYPSGSIQKNLSDSFKMFKDISLKISTSGVLEVSVTPRKGAYLWCGDMFANGGANPCYFMDDGGYIFEKAPYFSGSVYFKFYGKLARDESDPAGENYLSGIFSKIISFKNTLDQMNIKPMALQGMDNGEMEFFLYSPNSSSSLPPAVIFNSSSDFTKLAENLQTALSTEPLKSEYRKKYASLQYIDLRYGNKVYYKFK